MMYTSQKAFHETSLQQFNTITNRKESLALEKYYKNSRSPPINIQRGSHLLTTDTSVDDKPLQTRRLNQQSNADGIGIFGVEIKQPEAKALNVYVGMQSVTSLNIDQPQTAERRDEVVDQPVIFA